MRRSTYPLISCRIVRHRFHGLFDFRRTKTYNAWGQNESGSSERPETKTPRNETPRASATSTVMSDAASYSRGANTGALERRINREDNMWRDRSYIDTKWLNPRDPSAYRPNFRQTEPMSLRKQFMRSPDEISREVMGRDWEETVKSLKRNATPLAAVGTLRNESQKIAEATCNRQQHLQLMQMQQDQQKQQQQQRKSKKQQSQPNYWGTRNLEPPKDQ
ncbi:PH domain-containing protein DDB_G0275795 [Drosophila ficusphila]|uniref:PH domain-containing protein DDB_G0275795 n=1 Tax=Drosophila ficusphila TaxID=30025 RepID=UPI0007E6F630|nr:PH domain-containing protein DDB_G0275795 [Drosophila ficusphila]XP_017051810.1 PH domain-containing protein DDB_G0275795 [Drosophila ficusphila]